MIIRNLHVILLYTYDHNYKYYLFKNKYDLKFLNTLF